MTYWDDKHRKLAVGDVVAAAPGSYTAATSNVDGVLGVIVKMKRGYISVLSGRRVIKRIFPDDLIKVSFPLAYLYNAENYNSFYDITDSVLTAALDERTNNNVSDDEFMENVHDALANRLFGW